MSDDNFYNAQAIRKAAYAAERLAERLHAAQVEVLKRQEEVDTRAAAEPDPAAVAAFGPALARQRHQTALQVAQSRLDWALESLRKVESE